MAPGARSKFDAPMIEPEVFRKQMYCIEESAYDIVVTFCSPLPSLCPWWCAMKIRKFSENKQIFKSERHELLFHEHLQFSNTLRHGSCTDCHQRFLAASQVSSSSFVSLLRLPHAFSRRGPVLVLLIIKLFRPSRTYFFKVG